MIEIFNNVKKYADVFKKIPLGKEKSGEPYWINGWIPPIDGIMIYTFLGVRNPPYYVECGSGNTTKFAAKSIRDNNLRTKIISIDPEPRSDIDTLCYKIYRNPLEDMDPNFFKTLKSDDIFLLDNSHRAFPNSDVNVFFTEILPDLPKGILYALHDIALPDEIFVERFYNEQYLLATWLLAGGDGDQIYFPTSYLSTHTSMIMDLQKEMNLEEIELTNFGGFFWLIKG